MIIDILITMMSAILAGLIGGLLPGIGPAAVMIASFPLLFSLPAELCIIYYAVLIQASQFSGSVAAINFGLMGEMTSYPALAERQRILDEGLQKTALKFTAIGSAIACVIPISMLYPMLEWFRQNSVMMRTDFMFGVAVTILLFALLYRKNNTLINLILTVSGVIISQIGLHGRGSTERDFLTFGQPFMFAGVPMIAVIGGMIVVPLIMQHLRWQHDHAGQTSNSKSTNEHYRSRFPLLSSIRGSVLGLFTGLIPAIGTQIGSYAAWFIEKKLYPRDDQKSIMARLTAAESANNGSAITVLVPLLVLGIAIVPSEMILLGVIETKFWIPGQERLAVYGLNFYAWLAISLIMCSLICYLLCYSFLHVFNSWLRKNLVWVNRVSLVILALAVVYAGSLVEAKVFFLSCFLVLSAVALFFRKTDFIPLIVGYFIGDSLVDSFIVLQQLYF